MKSLPNFKNNLSLHPKKGSAIPPTQVKSIPIKKSQSTLSAKTSKSANTNLKGIQIKTNASTDAFSQFVINNINEVFNKNYQQNIETYLT